MKSSLVKIAAVIAAMSLAACVTPDPVSTTSNTPTQTVSAATGGNGKEHYPNSAKYKNNGIKPATGRSGSASLEARALVARNGSTQLEVTTGSLEAGTKPGNLDKVQVKILSGKTSTTNFNNLKAGGYWTNTYNPGLARGTQVQVQANISGIDGKRTDVVTVTAAAAKRPDVKVNDVAGPAQSLPHAPVIFTATLSELNGDVGARANCVLSVNGSPVDQANGIWIDAGGTITCAFAHTFEAPGSYSVSVSATNVNPGDWDLSNNSASTSITIQSEFQGTPIANGELHSVRYHVDERYDAKNTDGAYPYLIHKANSYDFINTYLYAWESGLNPGIWQSITAALSVDGAIFHTSVLNLLSTGNYDDGTSFQHCGTYDSPYLQDGSHFSSQAEWAQACSYGNYSDPDNVWTYYYYQQAQGDAVYYSRYYNSFTGEELVDDWDYVFGSGSPHPGFVPGAVVRVQLGFLDAHGESHTADQSVTLEDLSAGYNTSSNQDWYEPYLGENLHSESSQSGSVYAGDFYWGY